VHEGSNFARARALFRLRSERKRISENHHPPGVGRSAKTQLGATSVDVHACNPRIALSLRPSRVIRGGRTGPAIDLRVPSPVALHASTTGLMLAPELSDDPPGCKPREVYQVAVESACCLTQGIDSDLVFIVSRYARPEPMGEPVRQPRVLEHQELLIVAQSGKWIRSACRHSKNPRGAVDVGTTLCSPLIAISTHCAQNGEFSGIFPARLFRLRNA
jgi:hypothetical protein